MVSIRRRELKGRCNGRSSSLASLVTLQHGNAADKPPGRSRSSANVLSAPSVPLNKPVEVKEETDVITNLPTKRQNMLAQIDHPPKRQKIHVQIDPENPMEVHAYLMKLKEDKKLEIGPLQWSKEMPVKEWMEKCYPYIFSVFPQSPEMILQFPDKSNQSEFLYSHYWLFLFEVRNIVSMDYHVSPEYVESLGKVIKTLEVQGFDCRFMRSEMSVVGYMMKKQREITLALRNMIAERIVNLERELKDLARKNENNADLSTRVEEIEDIKPDTLVQPKQTKKVEEHTRESEGEQNKLLCRSLKQEYVMKQEYVEVVLERHKKILACKEEEGKRLDQVLERMYQLHQNK